MGHWLVDILFGLVMIFVDSFFALINMFFPKKKDVTGELVLITGGASGLGRLLCLLFAERGANIVIWDIQKEAMEEVAKEVRKKGSKCFTYVCDLSKRESIYESANQVKRDAGDVFILINNAGIVSGKKLLDCSDSLIEKTFQVNTVSHFWTTKSFLPRMLERNHGHIVTIASNAGMMGVAGLADYCASKFGAFGFDESLRFEFSKLKKDGVKTTVVCPYYINTGMFDGVKTKVPFLPILEPNYVAQTIFDAILTNTEVVVIPKISNLVFLARALMPTKSFDRIARALGVSDTMDEFKGREKKTN